MKMSAMELRGCMAWGIWCWKQETHQHLPLHALDWETSQAYWQVTEIPDIVHDRRREAHRDRQSVQTIIALPSKLWWRHCCRVHAEQRRRPAGLFIIEGYWSFSLPGTSGDLHDWTKSTHGLTSKFDCAIIHLQRIRSSIIAWHITWQRFVLFGCTFDCWSMFSFVGGATLLQVCWASMISCLNV